MSLLLLNPIVFSLEARTYSEPDSPLPWAGFSCSLQLSTREDVGAGHFPGFRAAGLPPKGAMPPVRLGEKVLGRFPP